MPNLFQWLMGAIRGGTHPREIGLAVFLGVLAGFVSGWNLTLGVVMLAVLLLRTPPKMFAQTWAMAAGVAWALTPVTFRVGHFALTGTPLGSWLSPHADGPWIVLFDLDRYTLLGGLLLAPLLALPAAWILATVTRAVQDRLTALQEKILAKQWQAPWTTRAACWLLFGGDELCTARPAHVGWFRKMGVAAGLFVVAPLAFWGWREIPGMLERGVLNGLSLANQAEVNADRFDLRLSEGVLEIEGLQVADPRNLDQDRLRIDHLSAAIRPGPLLRGQLLVDHVIIGGITQDVARTRRARPYHLELPTFKGNDKSEPRDESPEQSDLFGFGLSEYAKDWKGLEGHLLRVKDLVEKVEHLSAICGELCSKEPRSQSAEPGELDTPSPAYAQLRAMRHSFGPRRPAVWIAQIRASNLAPAWGFDRDATVQLSDLASDPELLGRPAKLLVTADQGELRLAATFNVHRPGMPHDVEFAIRDVPVERLVDVSKVGSALSVQAGKLDFAGHGTMTAKAVDLPLQVSLRDFNVRLLGEGGFGGLTPDLWNQGLSKLSGMELRSRLTGRWHAPRLRVNTKELAEQFQSQLRAAGQVMLAQAVETQLARGRQMISQAVHNAAADAQQAIARQKAQVDAAISGAQRQVSQAAEAVQSKAVQAQQTLDSVQDKANSKADQLAAQASRHMDRVGATGDWLTQHNPLPKVSGGLFGNSPLGQAASESVAAVKQQSEQQVDTARRSTAGLTESGAAVARSPLADLMEKSAAADQAARDGTVAARGQLDAREAQATDAMGSGAAAANQFTDQAAQQVRSSMPGGEAATATMNRPAAIAPYTEMRPGSGSVFSGSSRRTAPAFDGYGGGTATAEDDPAARAPGNNYPTTAPSTYESPGIPNYHLTARAPAPLGSESPSPGHGNRALPYDPETPLAPPGSLPANPAYSPTIEPRPPASPNYGELPGAPFYPTTRPQQPITSPSHPQIPPSDGNATSGLYPRSIGPGFAERWEGYATPTPMPNIGPPSRTGPPAPADFYNDDIESPAYEAGGRYEPTQPPQEPAPGFSAGPPLPQAPNWQAPGQTHSPPSPGQPPQSEQPKRRLPVALRGREMQEEGATRQGPKPVALRGRPQPNTAPAQDASASDEWQVMRWTRDAGSSVKQFIFGGSSEPAPENSPPQPGPNQPIAVPVNNQPPVHALRSFRTHQPPRQEGMPTDMPYPGTPATARRPVTSPAAPAAAPQDSKPWYQFW